MSFDIIDLYQMYWLYFIRCWSGHLSSFTSSHRPPPLLSWENDISVVIGILTSILHFWSAPSPPHSLMIYIGFLSSLLFLFLFYFHCGKNIDQTNKKCINFLRLEHLWNVFAYSHNAYVWTTNPDRNTKKFIRFLATNSAFCSWALYRSRSLSTMRQWLYSILRRKLWISLNQETSTRIKMCVHRIHIDV